MEKYHLYIVLTRTNTFISKAIHLLKNDEYTHAAISLDRELNQMYSFGRKHTRNPFVGRFKKEAVNQGVYMLCKNVPSVVIEISVTKQQYEKVKLIIEHFIRNNNLYKYNYIGLLFSIFQISVYHDYRFLCSEFVYYILNENGIIDFKTPRSLVRPQNFLNIKGRITYIGNLNDIDRIEQQEPLLGKRHGASLSLSNAVKQGIQTLYTWLQI